MKGNTDLKGAVIASTDKAIEDGKNSLTTATLTQNDIQNKADARAESSGITLSSDMFTQGKYGAGKAIIGNALNNSSESDSASGQTHSAVSAGTVTLTDETGQQQRTGKTIEQTLASLNRDTANAQTAARRPDVQAMEEAAQAEKAIKQAVYVEAAKFTDEAYRTMFIKEHAMYEVTRDENGKPQLRLLTEEEKHNLQAGPDGKVSIAANGIFNNEEEAAQYALQHGTGSGPQYLIHFPEADNAISELLVAGYQKFLENDYTGLTNSTVQVKDSMIQYGQNGLQLDGHSRGSMTLGNAMESLTNNPNTQGSLSGTTVNFFGPAYNAQQADRLLSNLQNRSAMPEEQQPGAVLHYTNHVADPVGGLIGGNPPTGGTIPAGSSELKEEVRAATGQDDTSHNCYGNYGDRHDCELLWSTGPSRLVPIPQETLSPQMGEAP